MADEQEKVEQEAPGMDASSEQDSVASDEAAVAAASAEAPAAPEPQLAPKQRRTRARATKAGKQPKAVSLTPEERQTARDVRRAKKAIERRGERAHLRAKYKAAEHERQATPPREHVAGNQKTRQGIVVSDKADKTITVRIDVARRHRRYAKIVRTSNTVHAHDERNDANIGDTVVVRESRPLSRTKRWRLVEIVERAK
jgi:small subunit ribosomal protein S17